MSFRFWIIALAVGAAITQLFNSWLGYHVSTLPNPLTPKQRLRYHIAFIGVGIIGVFLVGLAAYRSGQERAHFRFTYEPTNHPLSYGPNDDLWSSAAMVFPIGKPLSYNVNDDNVGNGPAINVRHYCRTYIEPDQTLTATRDAVSKFDSWVNLQPSGKTGETMSKGEFGFVTCAGDIVTPEDLDNLKFGRRMVYVVGLWKFDDDFGSHTHEVCTRLQPPDAGGAFILAGCEEHTAEK